ncbi:hypothetical protein AAC387_Pa04g1144 [Persea americana]
MEETPNDIDFRQVNLTDPSPLLSKLHQTLTTCAKSLESDDFSPSNASLCDLIGFLDSISGAALSDPNDIETAKTASLVLAELHRFVSSPSLSQMVVDALSFELPKAAVRFSGVSEECRGIVDSVVGHFVAVCNPRDMHSVLCEALESLSKDFKAPVFFLPLFSGLLKVFLRIQRRHFEQVKVAFPVILNVLKVVSLESEDEDKDSLRELVSRAIDIATSVQTIGEKLVDRRKKEFHALLGLCVLQIMALTASSLADKSTSVSLFQRLSRLLPFCGLSYIGLITGFDVDASTNLILEEDRDDFLNCFSFVKTGACLAVIWGHISNEVAKATGEDLIVVKDKLKHSQTERWQAIGMLKYVLSAVDQSWELKSHAIDFLLSILDENVPRQCNENHLDFSSYVPGLFSALQALGTVMMYTSDAVLRKKAYAALKCVLRNIPSCERFDLLKALIMNSNSSSMIAILMDFVKEEILKESQKVIENGGQTMKSENKVDPSSLFWSVNALGLVEYILKPPKGGPPTLPEQSESVVSALNLYRFLLIMESTGKTNRTGILSEKTLRKAYMEWLLPLRTVLSGIEQENQSDYSEIAVNINCSLNPVQVVLYRCIELVEENLKQCK